ncbi:MAG TPA: right-handed parallel beta-helix repeat-containing protein [Anaerohalosphaeraceae bacterium]|nr:right-handed parallel beta-helix repeat-containing protein [Anaerohalosphaeraceae bacterium]
MKRELYFLLSVLFSARLVGGTLYVPTQYGSIQSAINAAAEKDVIIVQPGTYVENINFLGKKITVQSADPDDPNVVAATIIDGSAPDDPAQASVVTFSSGEDNESILTGFTIRGGTGSWIAVAWKYQGLRWNRCGGGVVCYNLSAPTIEKNVFIQNSAGQGGAIYLYGNPVNPSDPVNPAVHIRPVIRRNTFISNTALISHGYAPPDNQYPANDHGDGGAIVAFQGVDAEITDNRIGNNRADYYGGGIHCRQWSNSLIEGNTIESNSSLLGGGVHITYFSNPTVRSNTITQNNASSLGGGGIYVYYQSAPVIERNLIKQNSSTNGAGIAVFYQSSPVIRNNLIVKNTDGSGIVMTSSWPQILFNTIADNDSTGIYLKSEGSSPAIENNIIASNGSGWGIYMAPGNSPTVSYNNVWGNSKGQYYPDASDQTGRDGNISADPQFADSAGGNYHLNITSPCINDADPAFSNPLGLTDYAGQNRILGSAADMGALEALPVWNLTSGSQYLVIQQAIDDSISGDRLAMIPGIYRGDGNRDIEFRGKSIVLQSLNPENPDIVNATIIDCQGSGSSPHRAFWFRGQEDNDAVLQGITIINGGGRYDGGAIKCGGLIESQKNSNPTIRRCVFKNNAATGYGGAIYVYSSNPVIADCVFISNMASDGYGGAIACTYASPLIANCIITGNKAVGADHHGGGICCWGGNDAAGNLLPSNPLVINCSVTGNSADHRGGGFYAYWSQPTFINCTVVGNRALEGGGIASFRESNPSVINCIVRDNRSPDGNQLALINTSRVWPASKPTAMTVSYSNIKTGTGEITVDASCLLNWGSGNIDSEPLFLNPGMWIDPNTPANPHDDWFVSGNYHIVPESPCLDAGDNLSVPWQSTADIDGEARICGSSVDIGADEVYMDPADFNSDGTVDTADLLLFADSWLQNDPMMDLNKDSIINAADFVRFASGWLWKAQWYPE